MLFPFFNFFASFWQEKGENDLKTCKTRQHKTGFKIAIRTGFKSSPYADQGVVSLTVTAKAFCFTCVWLTQLSNVAGWVTFSLKDFKFSFQLSTSVPAERLLTLIEITRSRVNFNLRQLFDPLLQFHSILRSVMQMDASWKCFERFSKLSSILDWDKNIGFYFGTIFFRSTNANLSPIFSPNIAEYNATQNTPCERSKYFLVYWIGPSFSVGEEKARSF